jgi:hypothetical protein
VLVEALLAVLQHVLHRRDHAMLARWSANPLGMLWPEMDVAFVTSGGGNGGPATAARRPVVIIPGS